MAEGGSYAAVTGGLFSLANVFMYHHFFTLRNPGFSLIPTNLKLSGRFYLTSIAILLISNFIGSNVGMTIFGDPLEAKHLMNNARKIKNGETSFDIVQ